VSLDHSSALHELRDDDALTELVPPRRFLSMTLENYLPNPEFPSQARAVGMVREFVKGQGSGQNGGAARLFTVRRAARGSGEGRTTRGRGLYLDGGFGVGKTHLLVGAYKEFQGKKGYTTFSDLTYLVGALGFQRARTLLSRLSLLCIDEFELDDPGDTVLISNLCLYLAQEGVNLLVTSNTLPDRLGQGRFAQEDFLREIQGLAAFFDVVRVDGPDYRHRNFDVGSLAPISSKSLPSVVLCDPSALVVELSELNAILSRVHPVLYRRRCQGLSAVVVRSAVTFSSQSAALLFVSFIDKAYEMELPTVVCDIELRDIFPKEFLDGGFRAKYGRCMSRMISMNLEFDRYLKTNT
jgi:cell division protein ZapE